MATEWCLAKKEELTEVAAAIRNLSGSSAKMNLSMMKNELNAQKSNLEDIKTSLEQKGVAVPTNASLGGLSFN